MLGDVQGVARWLGKELGSTFSSKGSVGFAKSKSMVQQPLVRWSSPDFPQFFFCPVVNPCACMHRSAMGLSMQNGRLILSIFLLASGLLNMTFYQSDLIFTSLKLLG